MVYKYSTIYTAVVPSAIWISCN